MDLGLKGKVAMVAGSSKGLGYAVASVLAAEGAVVSIVSRDEKAIRSARERIHSETGAEVLAVSADLGTAEGVELWGRATLDRFGRIDAVFANTGGPPAGGFLALNDAAWQDSFSLLVLSAVRLSRFAIPIMQSQKNGSIVFSTSSSVKEPIPNLTLSNVLRGSVSSLAKTLAREFASDHIRVNHAIPGRIDTDRLRALDELSAKKTGVSLEEQKQQSMLTIPLGRYGSSEEFAKGVAFLLSDAASYITGATLQIDGGMLRGVV